MNTESMEITKVILVSKKQLLGFVAKWAVMQSPYHRPENLEVVIDKFHESIKAHFENEYCIKFIDSRSLEKFIEEHLLKIPEFVGWNERKNGNKSPYSFISRYDQPNPDDDFIDLGALTRNVANDITRDQVE